MKKLLLLLSLTIISQIICSQEIILTFQPADGASVIDSVKTTNPVTSQVSVTEGAEITLPDETTSVSILQKELNGGMVYPNPFEGRAEIQFTTSTEEEIVVSVANASGEGVLRQQKNLQPGMHRVQLSVKSQGMYFITIAGKEKNTSLKAVNLQSGGNEDMLYWHGTSPVELKEKSAKVEEGKLYHFEVYSGENTTVIADRPTESKTYEVEFHECKDADGKNYKIVQIGEQWWMAENLAYLPEVFPSSDGSYPDKMYYVYDYEDTVVAQAKETNVYKEYGVLYNWAAAMNNQTSSNANPSGIQGVCSAGWHLPSDNEWMELEMTLGMESEETTIFGRRGSNQGEMLKTTIGWHNSGNGTDEFGFSAIPGGWRGFQFLGEIGFWWTSTEYDGEGAWHRAIYHDFSGIGRSIGGTKTNGFSVRCVKD